jgi:hypothetical protein
MISCAAFFRGEAQAAECKPLDASDISLAASVEKIYAAFAGDPLSRARQARGGSA